MIINIKEMSFEGVEREYKALTEGEYYAKVDDVVLTKTKTNRDILIIKTVLEGEKMYNGAHQGGRKEDFNILLDTSWTGQILKNALIALGIDARDGDNIDVQRLIDSRRLIGKNVIVGLIKENYIDKNGKVKEANKIKYLKNYGEGRSISEAMTLGEDIPF